ncbi:LuxR C-terminal-related transcriptional regulator [Azospirillum agricola]|uniref:LuxR C-terminal-related transcriptional regulator n=1 Tax=Azospirillum agricola TaxID=1720247 RepID=UPI000A0F2DA5|nr:response regulator transcription factor [Azospirillum agricola]SMH28735.1 two component transcriptional regulator, LuxR family [Azospirillum lipoferum]
MTPTTVVLVDPNRLFREGMKRLFDGSRFQIVGEAADPRATVASQAAILLIDPVDDLTSETVQTLRAAHPKARLVVLTGELDAQRLTSALKAGVDGYLRKDIASEALMQSLTLVTMGEKVFPTDLAVLLIGGRGEALVEEPAPRKGLSQRERQILQCLLRGHSNKMIANHLAITEATVKVHLKSLLRKINASNRTQAAIWAMNNGIGQDAAETAAMPV